MKGKTSKVVYFRGILNLIAEKQHYLSIVDEISRKLATNPVPEWIVRAYVKLFDSFAYDKFDYDQAKECIGLDNVSMHLRELRRYDLVKVQINKKDTRRRVYQLK